MTHRFARPIVLGLALVAVAAGCGSDSKSNDAAATTAVAVTNPAAPDTTAAGAPSTTAAAAPDTTAPAATTAETTAATTAVTEASTAAADATISLATVDEYGDVIVDASGFTLYLFSPDGTGPSTCTEGCATAWPPVLADAAPTVGDGLDATLVGTTERADGTTQVTYAGHPLYRFGGDSAAGDANGQEVGNVWYVLDATGTAVEG
jgi:predicted lipoprotein with Yx(FWY)xxD motif